MRLAWHLFILFLAFWSRGTHAQTFYHFNQQIPVTERDTLLAMPWAGGLNTGQYNPIDLDNDGTRDLMIFNRDNNKVFTFLAVEGKYVYAPEYEHLFPDGLKSWVLLRDYNCDGKADLFTSSIFGMSLYENVSTPDGQLEWQLVEETIFTEGSSGQINLQVSSLDLPGISDYDGDGDLDIMVFNFAIGGGVYLHKNMSVERTGSCGLDLVKTTERYGDFEECTCDSYIFGNEICTTGGRLQHSGGKSLVSYSYNNQPQQDLVIGQEACTFCGYLQNVGTIATPKMSTVDFNFPNATNPITLIYPAIFNFDADFDGVQDMVVTNNMFTPDPAESFSGNNWFYKREPAGYRQVTKSFLQDKMIDAGYAASPAVADIDTDGDEDLLLGYGKSGKAGINLYVNTGDALNPQLTLTDHDYLALSAKAYDELSLQFFDFNNNGRKDLIIGGIKNGQQSLSVYWHTGNSLQPFISANMLNLQVPQLAAEDSYYFYNTNNKTAMLMGRVTGRVSQYVNQSTAENPQWELVTDAFLGIIDNFRERNPVLAISDINGDGKQDVIRYDNSGKLRIYLDYQGLATLIENVIQDKQTLTGYNSSFGMHASITTSYITGSTLPSILIGLQTGGVQVLSNVIDDQQAVNINIQIALYPNPVKQDKLLNLVSNQEVKAEIIDVWGHKFSDQFVLSKGVQKQLDINALRAGLYMLRAQNSTGKSRTFKFVITR